MHHFGEAPGDGESQARAAELARALAGHLREGAEDVLLLLLRNANAGVRNFEDEVHARFVRLASE